MREPRGEEPGYRLTHYKTLAPCPTIRSVQQYGVSPRLFAGKSKKQ